jgi:hypothetical protein
MYISLSHSVWVSVCHLHHVHSGQRLMIHMEYGQEEHLEFWVHNLQTNNNFFQTNRLTEETVICKANTRRRVCLIMLLFSS